MSDLLNSFQAALAERYRIDSQIGRGGMGTVYLAQDLRHDRQVALKVLLPELSTTVGSQRFLREVKIAAGLQHPHILPIYDSGEAEGLLFYVMPYVEGQTLRERLKREVQLPLEDAVQIARDVANALSYAHRRGIVHRDIKPENILLSEGYAVVADFGIARALTEAGGDKLTQTGMAIGTPSYMSPEQTSEELQVDGRSDLYSLGCVLYEMLAGQPPFTGATPRVIIARHLLDPVPPLRTVRASVPESLERAVAKSLEKVPADRFSSGEQLINALTWPPAVDGLDLQVTPPPGQLAPSFFAELKRRRVYQAAILYVAIGFGLVEVADLTFPVLGFPAWMYSLVVFCALVGFPITLILAWMYDLTSQGLRRTGGMRLRTPSPEGSAGAVRSVESLVAAEGRVSTTVRLAADAEEVGERVSAPVERVKTGRALPEGLVPLLTSKIGLTSLLALVFFANWVETTLESWLGARSEVVNELRHQAAQAVHWLEGNFSFEYHDVTNNLATIGYSSSYFFVFPLLAIAVGLALARRPAVRPYRVFSLAIVLDYLLSLPFFMVFPVPERWAYSESGAMLLSDKWSTQLIELFRPISGLDNCFPSFHVSLTVLIVLVSFIYGLSLRWSVLALGATVVLSTYVLGIHWGADIVAGLAVGVLSVMLAIRLDRQVPEEEVRFVDIVVEQATGPAE